MSIKKNENGKIEEEKQEEVAKQTDKTQELCEESSSKEKDSTQHRWGRKEDKDAFRRLREYLAKEEITMENFLAQVCTHPNVNLSLFKLFSLHYDVLSSKLIIFRATRNAKRYLR